MDHTQAYLHCFTKTHAHVHVHVHVHPYRCQPAFIEQSEKHTLTVCPCEDEGRTKQRKDGGQRSSARLEELLQRLAKEARGCELLWGQAMGARRVEPPIHI